MLILVRKVQQGIWIQGDIIVTVLGVDRDRVKIGITAPSDVKVMRHELIVEMANPGVNGDGAPGGASREPAAKAS